MKFRVRAADAPLDVVDCIRGVKFEGPDIFVADSEQEASDWSSDKINRLGLADTAHVIVDDLGNAYGVGADGTNVCAPDFDLFTKIVRAYGDFIVDGWGYCTVRQTGQKLGFICDVAEQFGLVPKAAAPKTTRLPPGFANLM